MRSSLRSLLHVLISLNLALGSQPLFAAAPSGGGKPGASGAGGKAGGGKGADGAAGPSDGAPGAAPGAGAGGDGGKKPDQCYAKLLKECNDAGQASAQGLQAGVQNVADTNKEKMNGAATGLTGALGAGSLNMAQSANTCAEQKKKCKSSCKEKEKIKACEDALDQRKSDFESASTGLGQNALDASKPAAATSADGPKPQSTPSGDGGGGMGGMGAAVMGAAAGGLLAYMMMKKNSEDDEQLQNQFPGAMQANGTIDCSKYDGYAYSGCNTYYSQLCATRMVSGQYGADATCQAFSSRYCSPSSGGGGLTSAYPAPVTAGVTQVSLPAGATPVATAGTPTTMMGAPAVGVTGEGLTNDPGYCQNVLAFNYCAQGGRASCPSCMQLASTMSASCQSNPLACMGQNSTAAIVAARTTCPTDPIFANPAYANITTAGTVATTVPGDVGPVILPASVNGAGGAVGAPAGLSQSASTSGAKSPASGAGLGSSKPASANSNAYQTASLRAAATNRDIANVHGTAEANAGPASDVVGPFGPSLFSTSTSTIRNRCQNGKLNCN